MAFDPIDREIRVFISSTFKDMSAEREYLINKVFPALQAEADRHRVRIVPVDLRWGITEQEANNGHTASICLNQIDEARPFFIGLVGWRYGWCPTHGDVEEARRHCPRIAEWVDHGMSMTEIEMQYGVLGADKDADALFMLKSDAPSQDLDQGIPELREKILEQRPDDTFWYDSLEQIGEHVRRRLLEMMDKYFPVSDASEAEQAVDFIWERAMRNEMWYAVTCEKLPPIETGLHLLVGPAGSGKTTTAEHRFFELSDDKHAVVYLHIDNDRCHYDREMCMEMLRIQIEGSVDPYIYEQTREDTLFDQIQRLGLYLQENKGKRLHLIIDGLEHVDDWPVRQFCSDVIAPVLYRDRGTIEIYLGSEKLDTALGRTLQHPYSDITAEVHQLPKAGPSTRWLFVLRYLRNYAKSLPNELSGALAQMPISIRLLRMLLDEIVAYGTFETLPQYIDQLMHISDEAEFYHYILAKASAALPAQDMRQMLSVLAAIVTGLPEDVLQRDVLQWTPLQWAETRGMLRSLLKRNKYGICLVTTELHNTVESLVTPEEITEARNAIARALEGTTTHRVEQALQLSVIGTPKQLHQLVVNEGALIDMIEQSYVRSAFDMINLMLQADAHNLNIYPLLDDLKARLKAADPGSLEARQLRRAARRLFDFNNRCLRNLTFCGSMWYAPFDFDHDVSQVEIFRWILRGDTRKMIKNILSDDHDAASFVPVIEYFLRYGHLEKAANVAHKALEAIDNPAYTYPERRPVETAEIRLAAAYVAMRQGHIDRAHELLDAADAILKPLEGHYKDTLKMQAGRHIIEFLWNYSQHPEDTERLQASLDGIAHVLHEAEVWLAEEEQFRLELTRALVLLMLTQEGQVKSASELWSRAIDEQCLAFDNEQWLTRGEMPFWLEAAVGKDNPRWITNIIEFCLLRPDGRRLPEAISWNQRQGATIGLLKRPTPLTVDLQQRRDTRITQYADGTEDAVAPLRLIWPRLLCHYDDDIFMEAFDQQGGIRYCPLLKAWETAKRLNHLSFNGYPCSSRIFEIFEARGGDGMMENLHLSLSEMFAYWRLNEPALPADCHIHDTKSLRRAAGIRSLPQHLRDGLAALADCLDELDRLLDLLDRLRLARYKQL